MREGSGKRNVALHKPAYDIKADRSKISRSCLTHIMSLIIDLGPEVATFPACDDLEEVGAMIYAVDKVRGRHRLPRYHWSPGELVELGVPRDIAKKVSVEELLKLHIENGSVTWDEVRQRMI
jgi:hypothetical protein